MKSALYTCLLAGLLTLGAAAGHAQGIAPQAIKTDDGVTLVFNTKESFFAVDLAGDDVKPAPGIDGYVQVDKRLVGVTNMPDKHVFKTAGSQVLLPKEMLGAQMKVDLDEEQFKLQRPVNGVKQEFLTTPKGRVVLHWWFPITGAAEGATQRHYMTTVCNREVLVLRAPLLPGDTEPQLRQYLLDAMATVRESNDPINIKEYARQLRADK